MENLNKWKILSDASNHRKFKLIVVQVSEDLSPEHGGEVAVVDCTASGGEAEVGAAAWPLVCTDTEHLLTVGFLFFSRAILHTLSRK